MSHGSPLFIEIPTWAVRLNLGSHVFSMFVNALVTGLIAFRIFKVLQQVKVSSASNLALKEAPGNTLGNVLFMIIESGMILFSIQLVRLVVFSIQTLPAFEAFQFIVPLHVMINVIIRSNHYLQFLFLLIIWI